MQYAIAIDVGIKNLGICAYDFVENRVVHWDNVDLVPSGRYQPALNVQYVHCFVRRHASLFDKAAVVLVEKQMRCNMRIVEAVLQSIFFEKCVVIHARSIKAHYNIATRNYRDNKACAVEWVQRFVESNPQVFVGDTAAKFESEKKRDDLADSLLLVLYYLDTFSLQKT